MNLDEISLAGKSAIITGGGSGIGQGIACALAKAGVKVVVSGRRIKPLQETVRQIQTEGGDALAVQGDVSLEKDASDLVERSLQTFGHIDILINNAGVSVGAPIHELDPQDWDYVMAVNLRGPFLMARYVLPHMRRQLSGHILNISSESGLNYYANDGAYGVSKHALNAFGEYLQRENQDYNIKVNTICPGMVISEMTQNSPGLDHEKCLYPEDLADLVYWLLTRRSNLKVGTPVLIQTMLNPWK